MEGSPSMIRNTPSTCHSYKGGSKPIHRRDPAHWRRFCVSHPRDNDRVSSNVHPSSAKKGKCNLGHVNTMTCSYLNASSVGSKAIIKIALTSFVLALDVDSNWVPWLLWSGTNDQRSLNSMTSECSDPSAFTDQKARVRNILGGFLSEWTSVLPIQGSGWSWYGKAAVVLWTMQLWAEVAWQCIDCFAGLETSVRRRSCEQDSLEGDFSLDRIFNEMLLNMRVLVRECLLLSNRRLK